MDQTQLRKAVEIKDNSAKLVQTPAGWITGLNVVAEEAVVKHLDELHEQMNRLVGSGFLPSAAVEGPANLIAYSVAFFLERLDQATAAMLAELAAAEDPVALAERVAFERSERLQSERYRRSMDRLMQSLAGGPEEMDMDDVIAAAFGVAGGPGSDDPLAG